MTFVADESGDGQIVDRIRGDGHTVWYVAEMEPGIADDRVLDLSHQASAVLITADRDFGELIFRHRRATAGILLIRLAGLRSETKAALVGNLILGHAGQLGGSFSVLSPGGLRIRSSAR